MKKILYVEDNKDTAEAVKIILSKEGYHTEVAGSGKECLKKIERGFDLYLLDIMLPDMSGWAIFERLRKKEKIKVAFLSAIPISNERLIEIKNAGISEYISKPFTKETLLEAVNKIFNN